MEKSWTATAKIHILNALIYHSPRMISNSPSKEKLATLSKEVSQHRAKIATCTLDSS